VFAIVVKCANVPEEFVTAVAKMDIASVDAKIANV
jgi:hypothetical protein